MNSTDSLNVETASISSASSTPRDEKFQATSKINLPGKKISEDSDERTSWKTSSIDLSNQEKNGNPKKDDADHKLENVIMKGKTEPKQISRIFINLKSNRLYIALILLLFGCFPSSQKTIYF